MASGGGKKIGFSLPFFSVLFMSDRVGITMFVLGSLVICFLGHWVSQSISFAGPRASGFFDFVHWTIYPTADSNGIAAPSGSEKGPNKFCPVCVIEA